MKKLIFITLLALASVASVKAQQDPAYSMYMFNGLFLNPAYAGSQEAISLMAIYRHQWAGIEGAPRTANISVHAPFRKDQYALGMTISNDMFGHTNNFSVTPSFAYRLKIKKSRLCFGVQTSLAYYYQDNKATILADKVVDNSFQLNQNLFVPNIGFGIYAYGARYFVGVSAPHLLPSRLRDGTGMVVNDEAIAKVYNFYLLTAGYVFGKDASVVKFRPTILVRYQKGLPHNIPQFDINLALLLFERVWIGAGYRTGGDQSYVGQSAIAFAQFKVTPQLQIGYSYDAEISSLRHFTSGTHEIMIGYDFWYDKKRFVSPRYIKYF